jgi:hypothetical protein
MSRILKRPMFRIGGSTNDGLMSIANPRKNYQDGTDPLQNYQSDTDDVLYKEAQRRADILSKFAGSGKPVGQSVGDLLISGGLNLLSGRAAGRGNIAAIAESFREPYQAFSKESEAEDAFKRQLKLAGVTGAMSAQDSAKLAYLKSKSEQVRPAFENVVLSKAKLLQEALPYDLKSKAVDAATKDTYFQRTAPKELVSNYIGIPNYITVTTKGKTTQVPALNDIDVGQVFYDISTGRFKKRKQKGYGEADFVILDSQTFEEKPSGE